MGNLWKRGSGLLDREIREILSDDFSAVLICQQQYKQIYFGRVHAGKEILNKRIGGNMEAAAQMIFYVENAWKIHNMQIFGLPSYGYEYKWRAYLNVLLHYIGDKVKPVKVAQKPGRHFYALAPGSRIWMELDLQQFPLQAGHHRRLLWIQRLT